MLLLPAREQLKDRDFWEGATSILKLRMAEQRSSKQNGRILKRELRSIN